MNKETVEAYAKAFCVLKRALDRMAREEPKPNSIALRATDIEKAAMYPARGFSDAMTKALRFRALTDTDNDLLTVFIDQVDTDDLQYDKPVSLELQGVWQQTYYKWRDLYTPAEVAEKLGVNKQRVSALMKGGQLDFVKIGNRCYIAGYSVEQRLMK